MKASVAMALPSIGSIAVVDSIFESMGAPTRNVLSAAQKLNVYLLGSAARIIVRNAKSFRWTDKKQIPRCNAKRNSGIELMNYAALCEVSHELQLVNSRLDCSSHFRLHFRSL